MPAPKRATQLDMPTAKRTVTQILGTGSTVANAMAAVNRTVKTYENWRANDREFAEACDLARINSQRARNGGRDPGIYNLSFADWRRRFLNQETYAHQQMWIDVLEGREPEVFHDSITYKPGDERLLCINTPPFHAKSTTITIQYVVYKLCMNPAFRVMIISKTAEMAAKFLFSIRQILTDPIFAELQGAYAPAEGFKPARGDGRWGNNLIYLAGRNTDAADKASKDPSVQAIGIGGQVYGARADLIILDDCVDDTNAQGYEKQFDWLTRTVMSRAKDGKILVVGTRVAPADLYSHLLNPDTYLTGKSPWTYIAQPAVLEYAENKADWLTLWPKSTQPLDEAGGQRADSDGLYPAWDGPALDRVRSSNRPGVWALVYMQQQVSEDMTFHPLCVWGSVDRRRKPGPLKAGAWGHPKNGGEGMKVIMSVDPAGTGEAFVLVYAIDRSTGHRWVLNAWTDTNTKPSWYADMIEQIHPQYGVHEIVIESNAYASWIIHDERIRAYCQQYGIPIVPHFTQHNKQDPDFGVATMESLFGTRRRVVDGGAEAHAADNVIHLPDPDFSPGIKALIEELLTWVPGRLGRQLRQDGPMALWFAELRARAYTLGGDRKPQTHARSRFSSPRARARQGVVPAGY
jgi:hypothetical protein